MLNQFFVLTLHYIISTMFHSLFSFQSDNLFLKRGQCIYPTIHCCKMATNIILRVGAKEREISTLSQTTSSSTLPPIFGLVDAAGFKVGNISRVATARPSPNTGNKSFSGRFFNIK